MKNDLLILGDVYLDRPFKISPQIDNCIFNLEFPLSNRGKPVKSKVNLRGSGNDLLETFSSLPLAVTLANNHIFDYGMEAFEDTIAFLSDNNISFFGAGLAKQNYNNPFIYDTGKLKIAFLSYCSKNTAYSLPQNADYGLAEFDIESVKSDISISCKSADKVICIIHRGEEEISLPAPDEIASAHKLIDLGADIIIQHHPHVIRPFEIYKEKEIFYSIGNFIFPDLDLKTYWDGNKYTRRTRKIQSRLNREGLVVSVDQFANVNTVYKSFQSGNEVQLKEFKPENQQKLLNSADYRYIYQKIYKRERRKQLVRSFLTNPRIPRARSVFELLR